MFEKGKALALLLHRRKTVATLKGLLIIFIILIIS